MSLWNYWFKIFEWFAQCVQICIFPLNPSRVSGIFSPANRDFFCGDFCNAGLLFSYGNTWLLTRVCILQRWKPVVSFCSRFLLHARDFLHPQSRFFFFQTSLVNLHDIGRLHTIFLVFVLVHSDKWLSQWCCHQLSFFEENCRFLHFSSLMAADCYSARNPNFWGQKIFLITYSWWVFRDLKWVFNQIFVGASFFVPRFSSQRIHKPTEDSFWVFHLLFWALVIFFLGQLQHCLDLHANGIFY